MTSSIVRQLVARDLYLLRWPIAGTLVAGAGAIAALPLGGIPGYVGGVSLICALIILNIFLVMSTVVQERKDKIHLFLLSLPISPGQYLLAKGASTTIAFGLPWVLLTTATLVTIDTSAMQNGVMPFWLSVLGYLLMYFFVLLAFGLVSDSTGHLAAAITIGNVSVNFLIPYVLSRPSFVEHHASAVAVWTRDIVALLALEVVVSIAALGIAWFVRSRNRDFV